MNMSGDSDREVKFEELNMATDGGNAEIEKLVGYEYTTHFVNLENNLKMSIDGKVGLGFPSPKQGKVNIKKFKNPSQL